MSEKRDFYDILGVDKGADASTIKKAYRKIAMKNHPDKNPDDKEAEEIFKAASEAYSVLSDDEQRAKYDRFGHAAMGAGGGFGGGGFAEGVNLNDIFGDLFGDMFGGAGGRRRSGVTRGADLRYHMEITFENAAFGIDQEITIPVLSNCESCSGSGAQKGTTPKSCTTCGGMGEVRMSQGFFSITQPCPHCHGKGKTIKDPCSDCHGHGQIEKERTLTVKVPAGVDEGTRLRLVGEGEAGKGGGPSGDLYVVMAIIEHPLFTRDQQNVHCTLPVSFTQAALGCKLEVPTLEGKVNLSIPAGSQPGAKFRMRKKGIKSLRNGALGDQIVTLQLEVPKKLSDKQKEILEEFADISGEDIHPNRKSFFDKVKELFD